jgi:hypothetical protein
MNNPLNHRRYAKAKTIVFKRHLLPLIFVDILNKISNRS